MVDITLIQGAIGSLKTASDIAKSMVQLSASAEAKAQVIELQSAILTAQSSALAAQSEQSTMIQRIRELEEEIARIKAWEEEKQRYQLIPPWRGGYVYALKEASKGTEPPHWICPRCYEEGRKSVLQNSERHERRRFLLVKCPNCGFEIERHGDANREYV